MTENLIAQTGMSEYDFLELECFVSKVGREGFRYAAEEYAPRFESETLAEQASTFGGLRALYRQHRPAVDAWYEQVGGRAACDLHNAHVDEARQREEDACLWGIRCTDGYIIASPTKQLRDLTAAELQANPHSGWRTPAALLRRDEPGGEWADELPTE
ncbi:hypothetical protein [Streptomyces syringium]|uniref:hypothetical protein n=1 Tax=Streptomyces syringium TaxID=76729 RepID=UPI003AAAE78B